MLENFIYAKHKSLFEEALNNGEVLDEAIVFIEDTKEIWNHGTYFDGSTFDPTYLEESIRTILNTKQDTIDDLDDIRSGANLGATSVLPEDISDMETKTNAANTYATKETVDGLNVIAIDADEVVEDPDISYIPKDLSMFNIYGESTSLTTANCYVIKEAGTYKFPLVYGNAIKNGSINKIAYTNTGATYAHPFVNYKGVQIASPYIEQDTGESVADVLLSIADTDNVFGKVSIITGSTCKYVKFKILTVPNTGANGVISIKNADGTIMWSWHIWVWKDDLTPVTITNHTGVNYDILPVNLASKWETDSSLPRLIYSWFYQWGRSVPLLPPAHYNSNTDSISYGELSFNTVINNNGSYQQGIINPTTFYCKNQNGANYNWFDSSVSYYNLWDQDVITNGASDSNTVKTIYDPCPPGFKIPNIRVFTGFTTTGANSSTLSLFNIVGSFSNGYYFKKNSTDTIGVFFPANGYRHSASGNLGSVGSECLMWSAASYSQALVYLLLFNSDSVRPLYGNNRAGGFSVRPVSEL